MDGNMSQRARESAARAPGGFVYWSLVLMGLAVFAPAVLLPEWRAYEALLAREQMERDRYELLKSAVDREKRMVDALRSDPAVIGRVAQRELGFQRSGEQVVTIVSSDQKSAALLAGRREVVANPYAPSEDQRDAFGGDDDLEKSQEMKAEIPAMVAPFIGMLPPLPYDFLFCDERTRLMMMVLGMSAIGAAVLLFGRKPTPDPEA